MNIKKIMANGNEIAIVNSDEILISDVQSALDFMMSVNYETGSHSIVLNKEAVTPNVIKLRHLNVIVKNSPYRFINLTLIN